MSNALENLKLLLSKVESHVNAQTVIGEPVQFGDVILVPLVDVCINMGAGLANKTNGNGGTNGKDSGGGVIRANMSPSAVIVINNGTVQLLDIKSEGSVNKFVDMIPGLFSIVKSMYNSHKENKEEKNEKIEKENKQQNENVEEPDVTIVVED